MPGVLEQAAFHSRMECIAAETGKTPAEVQKEAERKFTEMHSARNPLAVRLFAALGRFVRQRGYHHQLVFDHEEVDRLREESQKRSVIYLVTHKTYLDFFVLFDFLYRQGLTTPYIFGGINMNFAGFGSLARHAGGIFIRRSFRDDPVYKAVLQSYIEYLVEGGASFMWAIEGTRSRTGKLLVPRLGLLNYVANVCRSAGEETVGYIPVSVVYDQIPDVVDMAAQEAGAAKRPESLSWFFQYLRGMGGPFGNIYIRIGDAMAMTDTPDAPKLDPSGQSAGERQVEIQKLAFEICYRINEITPATMTSLILMVLLCRGRCGREQIGRDVRALSDYIVKTDRRVIMKQPSRILGSDPAESINMLLANGVIRAARADPEAMLEIEPEKLSVAIYYSNMAVHHFVISAFVEVALMAAAGPSDILPWCQRLRKLFKFEFFFSRSEAFRQQVARELEEMDPDWKGVMRQGKEAVAQLLRQKPLLVGAGVLSPFLIAYRAVGELMVRQAGACELSDENIIEICLQAARDSVDEDASLSRPALSASLLKNALRLMNSLGLRFGHGREVQAGKTAFLEELDRTMGALNRLQRIAQPS